MASHPGADPPYRTLNHYLRARFGARVHKLGIHAGLTCPNLDGSLATSGCCYCLNHSFNPAVAAPRQSISEQLQNGISAVRRRYKAAKFIAYFQTYSNTYGAPDLLLKLYEEAISVPEIVALAIATRPDCLSEQILEILSLVQKRIPLWLEIGMQSGHDKTLALIGRNHTVAEVSTALDKLKALAIDSVVHLILGLPEESHSQILDTARLVARLPVRGVKIHHLHAVKGTRLADWYREGKWQPLAWQDYVRLLVDFLELLPPEVVIHRVMGDCPEALLVAPIWPVSKAEILREIELEFARRSSAQGSFHKIR